MIEDKWKRMLRITKKVETGGVGNDHTPPQKFEKHVRNFKIYCPPDKFKRVLNLGAGDGGETFLLKNEGYDVTGITYGKDNLKMAKEQYGLTLHEMDMHDLSFADKSFDAVFTVQVFEHAFSGWMFVLEMRRILREGGRILIDAPSGDREDSLDTIWHTNVLTKLQTEMLFKKAGFKLIADLTNTRNLHLYFEKIPDGEFEMWGYVKHILAGASTSPLDKAIQEARNNPSVPDRGRMVSTGQSFTALIYNITKYMRPLRVFEWGPGQSTQAFLMGSDTVLVDSYEDSYEWVLQYSAELQNKMPSGVPRVIITHAPEEELYLNPAFPDKTFDIILIDGNGKNRLKCLPAAARMIKDNGVVLIHDAQNPKLFNKEEVSKYFTVKEMYRDPLQPELIAICTKKW